jgi:two-component system copper resistance phosphate regulon response regulator CusR
MKTMRILLIEDDRQHAAIIARGLRKHAFAVDVAADGEEGLFLAQTNAYDVLVLDVMLPKRTGIEVCRTLRECGSDVPVLMLTARDAVEDRITGLETGADDYLTKPFAFDEFVARVRALLRRVRRYEAPVLAVGDLTIDTAARSARRGERDIPLTSKEFALLEFLARNAGRVVGRAEISEHVWDISYDAFSNVIDVFIRRLRRKIDDGEAVKMLRTRRGAGYLLSAEPEDPSTPVDVEED